MLHPTHELEPPANPVRFTFTGAARGFASSTKSWGAGAFVVPHGLKFCAIDRGAVSSTVLHCVTVTYLDT